MSFASAITTPKAVEDQFPVGSSDPRTPIHNAHNASDADFHHNARARRGVPDRVFDKITNGTKQHFRISTNPYRLMRTGEFDSLFVGQCNGSHSTYGFRTHRRQVRRLFNTDREAFQFGEFQELAD